MGLKSSVIPPLVTQSIPIIIPERYARSDTDLTFKHSLIVLPSSKPVSLEEFKRPLVELSKFDALSEIAVGFSKESHILIT